MNDKLTLLGIIFLLMPMNIQSAKGIAKMIRARKGVK
jgi:hypothetical protein